MHLCSCGFDLEVLVLPLQWSHWPRPSLDSFVTPELSRLVSFHRAFPLELLFLPRSTWIQLQCWDSKVIWLIVGMCHLLIFSIRRFFLGPKIVTVAWTPNLSNQPKMIMIKWSETLFLLVRLIFYILKDIRWQNCLKQLELGLTRALAENITVWLHICRDEF